jgi:hypothetical protein
VKGACSKKLGFGVDARIDEGKGSNENKVVAKEEKHAVYHNEKTNSLTTSSLCS